MAHQNRVTPLGELIATPCRGLVYGNRGCLHDREGNIRRRYNGRLWIACVLRFQGRRRTPLMPPGRYTGLFFLDEATALAAGHRPCALCRRQDYNRLGEIWREVHPDQRGASAIDAQLHSERLDPASRRQRRHQGALRQLPDGAFVLRDGEPWLVRGDALCRWTPAGYDTVVSRPERGAAQVITPPSLVELLRAGYDPVVPMLHPTAAP